MVAGIIVAAGEGRRMGGGLPKQVLPVAGRPLVEHSLRAFQRAREVERIVLVIPAALLRIFPLNLGPYAKLVPPVDGGETRQASVRRGLEAAADAEWILVHDAARPLVTPALIHDVLEAARQWGAAVPACPVAETLKRVEGDRVEATVDRERMVRAQTPQAFRRDLLLRAHRQAEADRFSGTDDAQLVERLGEPVGWVRGRITNLKVTHPADLRLAETLLRSGAAGREET